MVSIGILCLISTLTFCDEAPSKEIEEFQTLFQQKRLHQLNAVKQLLNMSPKNQINLLNIIMYHTHFNQNYNEYFI